MIRLTAVKTLWGLPRQGKREYKQLCIARCSIVYFSFQFLFGNDVVSTWLESKMLLNTVCRITSTEEMQAFFCWHIQKRKQGKFFHLDRFYSYINRRFCHQFIQTIQTNMWCLTLTVIFSAWICSVHGGKNSNRLATVFAVLIISHF